MPKNLASDPRARFWTNTRTCQISLRTLIHFDMEGYILATWKHRCVVFRWIPSLSNFRTFLKKKNCLPSQCAQCCDVCVCVWNCPTAAKRNCCSGAMRTMYQKHFTSWAVLAILAYLDACSRLEFARCCPLVHLPNWIFDLLSLRCMHTHTHGAGKKPVSRDHSHLQKEKESFIRCVCV